MTQDQVIIGPYRQGYEEASDYYQKSVVDLRYNDVEIKRFKPTNSIQTMDMPALQFDLPQLSPGRHYSIKDMTLVCDLQLQMPNGSPLPDNTRIGLHNNILYSLFSECSLKLNNVLINDSCAWYNQRCYLTNLLGTTYDVKSTQFGNCVGYFYTHGNEFCSDQSTQYLEGIGRFAEEIAVTKSVSGNKMYRIKWKKSPVRFIGKVLTDLANCKVPILSGISIGLELKQSRHSQRLYRLNPEDRVDYELAIKDCCLYIPELVLTSKATESLKAKIISNPVLYNYRELNIVPLTIPSGSREWNSANLGGIGTLPSRIYLTFNESSAVSGNYVSSPFEYKRKFLISSPEQLRQHQRDTSFQPPNSPFGSSGSRPESLVSTTAIALSQRIEREEVGFFRRAIDTTFRLWNSRYRRSISPQRQPPIQDHGSNPLPLTPPIGNVQQSIEFTTITDIKLHTNHFGDLKYSTLDDNDPIVDYFRFNLYQGGYSNGYFSSGINYNDFRSSYFIKVFDLSSNNQSFDTRFRPPLKRGQMSVTVKFSKPTKEEITCLMFAEVPKSFRVDHNRKILTEEVEIKL